MELSKYNIKACSSRAPLLGPRIFLPVLQYLPDSTSLSTFTYTFHCHITYESIMVTFNVLIISDLLYLDMLGVEAGAGVGVEVVIGIGGRIGESTESHQKIRAPTGM